jgi:hypothetical protein
MAFTSMASLFRLRLGWQSDKSLTGSEWNLSPQHSAMLSLEHAYEKYIFLLIRRLDRTHLTPSVDACRTTVNVSPQQRTTRLAWVFI